MGGRSCHLSRWKGAELKKDENYYSPAVFTFYTILCLLKIKIINDCFFINNLAAVLKIRYPPSSLVPSKDATGYSVSQK